MTRIEYTPLNLPKGLVEELKVWKMAFTAAYGRNVSYGEMIRGMLDTLEESDPAVVQELDAILTRHPELAGRMGEYHSLPGQDEG